MSFPRTNQSGPACTWALHVRGPAFAALALVISLVIVPAVHAAEGQIPSSRWVHVTQSADATTNNTASRAVDGSGTTFSLTADAPGSFWMAEFGRPYPLTQIQIVNRAAPDDAELGGLTLRLLDMDDQVVFQTSLTNPGSAATLTLNLPAGISTRAMWIGLPDGQTNAAGTFRVGVAELRAYGVLNMPFGPEPPGTAPTNAVQVWQSSEFPGYPAGNGIDGNTGNFTHTGNNPNGFWMADLGRAMPVTRIEIVNRSSCCAERLAGLVLRIYDGASNNVHTANLVNVGLGGTWSNLPPGGTTGRWFRVGLENNQTNGGGNYYVTIAEARVFSGTTNVLVTAGSAPVPVTNNLASFKPAWMLRLTASVPAATNANDDNYSTETKTTSATVDGYWETDLGATYALYGVRSIAASGIGYRLTNTIIRLYDDAHESVFAQRVTGVPDAYDSDLNGPVFARYVRVGLEDKERTDPAGGIEWLIGFREVEVFGKPTNTVGVLAFDASTNQIAQGGNVTLSWSVADVKRVEIRPGPGSVGAFTGTNGTGNLNVTVSNTTEFVLIATNTYGIFTRAVTVVVNSNPPPVRISEFVAENKYSLEDGHGDASDWIELRNTGNNPVNLAGWGLSDSLANPMKWIFPATNLPPHATLIVFASGRNTPLDPAGGLHASFSLNKAGGSLVLSSPASNVVDSISAYPEQETDLAYGRDLDGNWTFLEPTPGMVNVAATYLGWLRQLDFSHQRGFHETAFTLTLTNNSPGASLVYSLDGTEPALPYTNGLAISGTRSVRAQAVRPGYKPPRVQTKTFIFINDVIASPLMNTTVTQNPTYAPRLRPGLLSLPTISICVSGQPEYDEKEGSVEIIWPDGTINQQINCGVSRFGNAWTKFAKRSFRLKCRARFGASKLNVPLLDGFDRGTLAATSFDKLDLRSGSQDMSERGFYMAGRFVEDSMLDMGSLNPHGRFVHIYLNGQYWGQYDCRESMDDTFMADYLGGARADYSVVRGNDNVGDDFSLGAPEPPVIAPWERVLSLRSSYNAVRPYLDVPHLIDFMVLWNYGNCESEYRSAGTVNAGTGFKFWISDADGFLRPTANGLNRTARNGPGLLWNGLMTENHSDFKTLLADRIYRHFFNGGALTPSALDARLAARMQEINDSLLLECARWNFRTPASWVADANTIRSSVFPARTSELFGMLRAAGWYPSFDPPAFNQFGGPVTNGFRPVLSSAAGTIYYTLDGTDPRLAGGGISPSALVWLVGAVTITNELTITARVYNGSQWSALAQPRFVPVTRRPPSSRDLLITEINYNPDGSDEFEFVELHNVSGVPLDLSGVALTNAARFLFPVGFTLQPGTFVVVVENTNQFAARYQTPGSTAYWAGLRVAGEWSGALNNAGDTVSLLASNGTVLATVSFKTGGEWPSRANGGGSSLELRTLPSITASDADVRAFVADGGNWKPSSLHDGSPGRLDSFSSSVRINELLSHSLLGEDWIELFNPGTQAVSLANCTLTDSFAVPARYVFSNTTLAAGQFLVLTATQLGFAFGEMGEEALLLQMSGTNVLRFLDTVDFPAAPPEEPFGVFAKLDGGSDFTELLHATPGATNATPRVGPLVISEIMTAPAPGFAQFVEITSLTNVPVELYDPAFPTNVWAIEGVGGFSFPTGSVIAPLGAVIVCATNPAAFRAQYGVGTNIPVFGPWTGTLDADGETLKLLRPGPPQTNGLPMYRVDHVSFRTHAPWPLVPSGYSLQKATSNGYGNDAIHWTAAIPTPGTNIPPEWRPAILTQPESQTINDGQTALFSVVVTGAPPVSFQWRFNATPLAGMTNATLVLSNVQIASAGTYDVVVFGPGGSVVSAPAVLTVFKPPVITLQPVSRVVAETSNAVFTVAATGNGTLRYEWRLNGASIPGATNTTFSIASAGPGHAGTYTVLVSDDFGWLLSVPATLTVVFEPFIIQQPLSQTVPTGGVATFSVAVTNTATLPINYRWRRGGFTITNFLINSHISFVTVSNIVPPNTNYTVFVTNVARPAGFLSATARISLVPDTNNNRLPDAWEILHGLDPGNPANANLDSDGDGHTNWEEYTAGTDPTNAASYLRVDLPPAGAGTTVRFAAVSNRTYSVLFNTTPGTDPWTKLADVVARDTNRVELIPDPGWSTNRYYRVVTPRQP